jgi:hypothetical protein
MRRVLDSDKRGMGKWACAISHVPRNYAEFGWKRLHSLCRAHHRGRHARQAGDPVAAFWRLGQIHGIALLHLGSGSGSSSKSANDETRNAHWFKQLRAAHE